MSVVTDEDPFVDTMNDAADFLSHYGVKGMKWGKRTVRPDEAARKAKFGPKSKSGVVKEAPSEDAAKVGAINTRVKTQKSTKMLSNKELQDAITRMNLEQQYSKISGGLDKTFRQEVSSFIRNTVGTSTKQSVQQIANNEAKALGEKWAKAMKS